MRTSVVAFALLLAVGSTARADDDEPAAKEPAAPELRLSPELGRCEGQPCDRGIDIEATGGLRLRLLPERLKLSPDVKRPPRTVSSWMLVDSSAI
jgi:hypothetical protein